MSIHKVTRGSCCRHLHLKAAASVTKNASPRRYSNHVGTAWGEPSGAVTATTAIFGSVRNCAISRLVIGIAGQPHLSRRHAGPPLQLYAYDPELLVGISSAVEFRFALFE